MKNLLTELENILIKRNNPIVNYMQEKEIFQERDFIEVLENLKLKPLQALNDIYSWRVGLRGDLAFLPDFKFSIFSFGNFIDYKSTSSLFILDKNTNKSFSLKGYLPIIYNGIIEDPVLIDLSKKSSTYGQIFYYSPNVTMSDKPVPIYDSLEKMIITICECYNKDVYFIEPDGKLVWDNKKESMISKDNNLRSRFWD